MWNAVDNLYYNFNDKKLSHADVSPEVGSNNAVSGCASYDNDSMQYLENRLQRMNKDNNVFFRK